MRAAVIGVPAPAVAVVHHAVATGALGIGALLAWVRLTTTHPAAGHAHHPADATGASAGFLMMWLAMVVAMMLPTIEPMVATFIAQSRGPASRRAALVAAFLAPYLIAWSAAGLLALGGRAIADGRPLVIAALVALSGTYQLTAVKGLCLRLCRTPLSFLLNRPNATRDATAAFAAGVHHAAVCVGCCAGLMVGLTAAGALDIVWMAALGALMLMEKSHPEGRRLARLSGLALIALAPTAALAPPSLGIGLAPVALAGIALTAVGLLPRFAPHPAAAGASSANRSTALSSGSSTVA